MTRTARPRIRRLFLDAVLLLAVGAETSAQRPVQPRGVLTRIPSAIGDGQDIPELAWYISWESPYGEGAVGEELGSPRRASGRVNPAYNAETGHLDLSKFSSAKFG